MLMDERVYHSSLVVVCRCRVYQT